MDRDIFIAGAADDLRDIQHDPASCATVPAGRQRYRSAAAAYRERALNFSAGGPERRVSVRTSDLRSSRAREGRQNVYTPRSRRFGDPKKPLTVLHHINISTLACTSDRDMVLFHSQNTVLSRKPRVLYTI